MKFDRSSTFSNVLRSVWTCKALFGCVQIHLAHDSSASECVGTFMGEISSKNVVQIKNFICFQKIFNSILVHFCWDLLAKFLLSTVAEEFLERGLFFFSHGVCRD